MQTVKNSLLILIKEKLGRNNKKVSIKTASNGACITLPNILTAPRSFAEDRITKFKKEEKTVGAL